MRGETLFLPLGGSIDVPYRHESATSKAAAVAVTPHQSRLQKRVYNFLLQHDGATIEEISASCEMRVSSACGRCRELVKLGLAKDSGTTRENSSKCRATVWVAT